MTYRRRLALAVVTALVAVIVATGAGAPAGADVVVLEDGSVRPDTLLPTPSLDAEVASGRLPPVEERIPDEPFVFTPGNGRSLGVQGGDWRMLVSRAKDVRLLVVYGYARLVVYDDGFELRPDILRRVEVEDGRIFTLTLRKGHRWSDGNPFTTEAFRFYWEDVANNEMLAPAGPPAVLRVDGELPRVEFIDELTVRYSWSRPNPFFLPALASAAPLFIYRPAHYLKQFHERYVDGAKLARMAEEAGKRNWAALHNSRDNMYRFDNPELPTLQPWRNTTTAPAVRFVAARNPYYHRVDAAGRQLPYIDRALLDIADGNLIPAKTGSGESDLQARGLYFNSYTFLKAGEKRHDYSVRLWRSVRGSRLALYPNLNVRDAPWRALIRDVRFRRALSLAINRHEINQVIYYGLGREGNNSVLPMSVLYRPEYGSAWASYDLDAASALLDEMGLTMRDSRGVRLMADGRALEIIVETAGEDTEQTDVLELIHDSWLAAGIKLYTKPSQREVFRNRIFAGETQVSIWFGYENAVPTPDTSPGEFAPTSQHGYHWPMWGQYFETDGMSGEPVDLPAAKELLELNQAWLDATGRAEREAVWHAMLAIHAEGVFTIGLVSGIPQPAAQRARERRLQLGPGGAFRHAPPGDLLVRAVRRRRKR